MSLEPAEQFSPMFQKIAMATFAATASKSVTSAKTSWGVLPPGSRGTRLGWWCAAWEGERRRRARLDDHGVAGGERGTELPGGHLGRVVPGDDRADDAHGLA